jgi:hypothetical protein
LTAALLLLGCDRGPRIDVHKVYPPPRLAMATIEDSGRVRYEATTGGVAEFALARKGERISGEVPATSGWLSVDADDVRSLAGELRFDVSRLTLAEQAEGLNLDTARSLLDVGTSRLATRSSFEILSVVESGEPRTEHKSSDDADGAERLQRVVAVTARGTLQLHGFRAVREASLELAFAFGAEPGPPQSVTVTSKRPLRLGPESFGLELRPGAKALGKLLDSTTVSVRARFLPTDR